LARLTGEFKLLKSATNTSFILPLRRKIVLEVLDVFEAVVDAAVVVPIVVSCDALSSLLLLLLLLLLEEENSEL